MDIRLWLLLKWASLIRGGALKEYVYAGGNIDVKLGQCVTLTAHSYIPFSELERITWRRDMLILQFDSRVRAVGRSLFVSSAMLHDDAYYQATIFNPVRNTSETTDMWLGVEGCGRHQRQVYNGLTSCETNCVDMCEQGWEYVAGQKDRCYRYFVQQKSWPSASETCQDLGAELATIENTLENEFIGNSLENENGAWIGLNDRVSENRYVWNFQQSRSLDFLAWGSEEPNNYNRPCNIENCVLMRKSNGKWLDLICTDFKPYVCEVPTSYNATDRTSMSCTATKCFLYFPVERQWIDARLSCRDIPSGRLGTIRNYDENKLVHSLLRESSWIALNDIWEAGAYVWEDSAGVSDRAAYLNWDDGEPNDKYSQAFEGECSGEDCVQIRKVGSKVTWHDMSCQTALPYVCEKIRTRAFGTGAVVGMVIGSLVLLALVAAAIYQAMQKSKRSHAKDLIKQAYKRDLMFQAKSEIAFREVAKLLLPSRNFKV